MVSLDPLKRVQSRNLPYHIIDGLAKELSKGNEVVYPQATPDLLTAARRRANTSQSEHLEQRLYLTSGTGKTFLPRNLVRLGRTLGIVGGITSGLIFGDDITSQMGFGTAGGVVGYGLANIVSQIAVMPLVRKATPFATYHLEYAHIEKQLTQNS